MLVVMQSHATEDQVRAVCERIESLGYKAHPDAWRGPDGHRHHGKFRRGRYRLPRMRCRASPNASPSASPTNWSAATPKRKTQSSAFRRPRRSGFRRHGVGMVAGPCAIETREQALTVAQCVQSRRRAPFSRRCVQTAHFALQFSRTGRAGTENSGGSARAIRSGHRHGSDRPRVARSGGEIRGCDSDWRAQHAEFLLLKRAGKLESLCC